MARLECINYIPHQCVVTVGGVKWIRSSSVRSIFNLPQIFWKDGRPWGEVNHWALDKMRSGGVKLKTVQSLMAHLNKYASWLEQQEDKVDWRHFPMLKSERVLVRYRGALIAARDAGDLKPSTTTARMGAVIQFYRHCAAHNFVCRDAPKWQDKPVIVRYFDHAGFERTLSRLSADIAIPNRARHGIGLEDGLLPITIEHQNKLLRYTSENSSDELHLLLMSGFFTGGRIGTLTGLRVESIESASPAPEEPGMWLIPIGPGTGIPTKFDVTGDLYFPEQLMKLLKNYAYSPRRLKRQEKAAKEHRPFLFLNRFGNPYRPSAATREMVELRRGATQAGLKFMKDFRFHQSRATFGTWLMTIALSATTVKSSIGFVRRAMHHKHESTTMRYITFLEHTKAKIAVANAFSEAFMGIASRMRDASCA